MTTLTDPAALTAALRQAETTLAALSAARDALLIECVLDEQWTHETAAEVFGLSRQRVGQLIKRFRAAHPVRDFTPAERAERARDAFEAARYAQDLRAERASGGNERERRAFYGSQHESPADETEQRIGLREWRELHALGRVEDVA